MEDREKCLFTESCINIILKETECFMSAFPSKIVFGQCSSNGYTSEKHFQFNLFELNKLYFCIFDTIKYFAEDSAIEIQNQLITTKLEQNYFFVQNVLFLKVLVTKLLFLALKIAKEMKLLFN